MKNIALYKAPYSAYVMQKYFTENAAYILQNIILCGIIAYAVQKTAI